MAGTSRVVVGGMDTHKHPHVAAVLDLAGVVHEMESFATTRTGYRSLARQMHAPGEVGQVEIEGTGCYEGWRHPVALRGRHRDPGGQSPGPERQASARQERHARRRVTI